MPLGPRLEAGAPGFRYLATSAMGNAEPCFTLADVDDGEELRSTLDAMAIVRPAAPPVPIARMIVMCPHSTDTKEFISARELRSLLDAVPSRALCPSQLPCVARSCSRVTLSRHGTVAIVRPVVALACLARCPQAAAFRSGSSVQGVSTCLSRVHACL